MTIDDLIDRSDYELFTKVCFASHSLYHLLGLYIVQVIRVCMIILFSCLITVLICIKNRSLFDLCMNICFIAIVLMCVCRILIKITYLLTYQRST